MPRFSIAYKGSATDVRLCLRTYFGNSPVAIHAKDISQAGSQKGVRGDRSMLVRHMLRLWDEKPPPRRGGLS